ncbi:MAG: MFS transporter [Kaiparowitsia implicata GSE-PSE-MK54-09C]|jgi:MFS family permease|nr:MFS transporter [Kaiparowitsia implicata GSE-PSE-MK54-09C]
MRFSLKRLLNGFPRFDYRVWILIAGRLLSQLGTGFTLFYAPIFFANQVGLSATAVGLGIGSGSIAGIVGRVVGGSLADSPRWGRRWTLLVSAAVSALADVFLAVATDFPIFLTGNLLMGLGIGLYWPATEAVVVDLTTVDQRHEAFAITRLGDSVGLGLGVVLGGAVISLTGAYRALFVLDGISFVVFFGVVYWAIAETLDPQNLNPDMSEGWKVALRDRALLTYAVVNSLLTTYLAHVNSGLPLYFTRFVPSGSGVGFTEATVSALFSWHIVLTVLTQLPIIKVLRPFSQPHALMVSSGLWSLGFVLMWVTGVVPSGNLWWAVLALSVMAIATVAYTPSASSLVVGLAPVAFRGVYLSVNSLCWAVGYFVGPALGGWAMDQPPAIAHGFWLASALSILVCIGILQSLEIMLKQAPTES